MTPEERQEMYRKQWELADKADEAFEKRKEGWAKAKELGATFEIAPLPEQPLMLKVLFHIPENTDKWRNLQTTVYFEVLNGENQGKVISIDWKWNDRDGNPVPIKRTANYQLGIIAANGKDKILRKWLIETNVDPIAKLHNVVLQVTPKAKSGKEGATRTYEYYWNDWLKYGEDKPGATKAEEKTGQLEDVPF